MKDFENKYIFHTLDSGLFHYDIANRHSLYDAARNRSKIASLAVRFTSWGLYDIELHRRIISDAWTKRNPEALGKALALYGIGLGIHYAIKKYGKEESELGKQANKFFYQRAPGTRLVDSLISRIDNPYGVIGSAAIQIKKTTQKANEGKFHYPSFLPKFPSVVSANDVKIMYRNIRDMVKKEGTKKEKDDIDIMGRALFDALDNPSNPEE